MADELRFSLIVIGTMAIVGLLIHGMWTVRKSSRDKDLITSKRRKDTDSAKADFNKRETDDSDYDGAGLDNLGVGKPRVVSGQADSEKDDSPVEEKPAVSFSQQAPAPKVNVKSQPVQTPAPFADNESSDTVEDENRKEPSMSLDFDIDLNDDKQPDMHEDTRMYTAAEKENVVTGGRPANPEQVKPIETETIGASRQAMKREQDAAEQQAAPQQDIIIINVAMPEGMTMSGASLLPQLLTMGFKFGEMNIFHRYEKNDGTGQVLFHLSNMFNPGTFDVDNMEQFNTRGVSLFMTLPGQGDAMHNFTLMQNAAKKLADEFGGELLDNERKPLTVQATRRYVDKIRDYSGV